MVMTLICTTLFTLSICAMDSDNKTADQWDYIDTVTPTVCWRSGFWKDDLFDNGLMQCNNIKHYLVRSWERKDEQKYVVSSRGFIDETTHNEYRLAENGIIMITPTPVLVNYKGGSVPLYDLIKVPLIPDDILINKSRSVLAITGSSIENNSGLTAAVMALNSKKNVSMLENYGVTSTSFMVEQGFKDDCVFVVRHNLTERRWNLTNVTRCDC